MSGFIFSKWKVLYMKYALNSEMARFVDKYTMEQMKVPGVVLMERAALSVANKVAERAVKFGGDVRIAVVCGCGNNGADGIALARILTWQGLLTEIIIAGNETNATDEFVLQKEIALNSNMVFSNNFDFKEYDIVVDALFGTGLSREITGKYYDIINRINEIGSYVISVDIPSGIDASGGKVLGIAVKAMQTVTFGYNKTGMLLYPGKEYAGEVVVADIGLYPFAVNEINAARYFTYEDIDRIPKRLDYSNKGTYLRTLVIAGSGDMSGAAYLSGGSAYRCGAGLVEILSHINNTEILRNLLPEAIISGYDGDNAVGVLEEKLSKADIVILGPGLSTDKTAKDIVKYTLENVKVPIIIDADALNIISTDMWLLKNCQATVIITPHIGEMSRLTGKSKSDILQNIIKTADDFAKEYSVVCVLKDTVTIVAGPQGEDCVYINTSGCSAMSKAGCGDVLTGVIAAMLSLRLEPVSAASMGVYIHGLAGEAAVVGKSSHSMLASDMLNEFGKILYKN